MDRTRLVLADESRLFRDGLKRILAGRRFEIVSQVGSIEEALGVVQDLDGAIDLLLCDPAANDKKEFDALRSIARLFPDIKVILLTNQISPRSLSRALDTGACGFLPKDITPEALTLSLELALLDGSIAPISSCLLGTGPWSDSPAAPGPSLDRVAPLSSRESQVLSLIADGLPNKIIASDLGMAEATVKVHVKALMRKLNVQNRTQAAIWARSNVLPAGAARRPAVPARSGY